MWSVWKKINSHCFDRYKRLRIWHGFCPETSQTSTAHVSPSPVVLLMPFLSFISWRSTKLNSICHQAIWIAGNVSEETIQTTCSGCKCIKLNVQYAAKYWFEQQRYLHKPPQSRMSPQNFGYLTENKDPI